MNRRIRDEIWFLVPLFAFKNSLNLTTKKTQKKLKIYRECRDSFAVKRFNFFLNFQSKFNAQEYTASNLKSGE
jgi:hypothetical protein